MRHEKLLQAEVSEQRSRKTCRCHCVNPGRMTAKRSRCRALAVSLASRCRKAISVNQIIRLDRQSLRYQRMDQAARERMLRRKRSYTIRNSRADSAGPAARGPCGRRECPDVREARGRSAPPANRFRFRFVIGIALPEKVCDKFQFSLRASTKTRRRFAGCRNSGNSTLAATRRFCESQRASESKLIASPRRL